MSNLNIEDHPEYKDLLELEDLIERKQNEIKHIESTPFTKETVDIGMGVSVPAPQHSNKLAELNELILKQGETYGDIYEDMYSQPTPDLVPNPQEIKNPTESYAKSFTVNDLINQYRTTVMPGASDDAILEWLQLAKPEQYSAAIGDYQRGIEDKESKESYAGEGFWSTLGMSLEEGGFQQKVSLEYFTPAMHMLMMDKWLTGDPEVDEERWLDILSRTPEGKLMVDPVTGERLKDQLLSYRDEVKNSPEINGINTEALKLMAEGKKVLHEYALNNPELQGMTQYLEESGSFWDDNGNFVLDDHIAKGIGSAVTSILGSILYGKAFNQSKNGVLTAIQWLTGSHKVKLGLELAKRNPYLKKAMMGLGQMFWGFNMEGASYLTEAYQDLTSEKFISEEQFERATIELKESFSKIKDENGNSPSFGQVNGLMNAYIAENYDFRDGKRYQKPIDDINRVADALVVGTTLYGVGSSIVEWLDVLTGSTSAEYAVKTIQKKTGIDFLSKWARELPFVTNWKDLRKIKPGDSYWKSTPNKLLDFGKAYGINGSEMMEEMIQTGLQQVIQTRPSLKYELGASLNDKIGFKQNILYPAAGGLFGGGAVNTATNIPNLIGDVTPINNYLNNINVEKQFKNIAASQMYVQKIGRNEYQIAHGLSTIDETTGELDFRTDANIQLKDPVTGAPLKTVYGTLKEAQAVANQYNVTNQNLNEEALASTHLWMNDIEEFKIGPVGKKFEVVGFIRGSEIRRGKVVEGGLKADMTIGIYKTAREAKNKAAELNKVSKRIKNYVSKKGYDNVEKNRQQLNTKIDNLESNNERTESVEGLDFITEITDSKRDFNNVDKDWLQKKVDDKQILSKSHFKIFIKGFMKGEKVIKNNEERRIDIEKNEEPVFEILSNQELLSNPQFVADNVKAYQEVLIEEGITPENFLQAFEELLGNPEGYINEADLGRTSDFEDTTLEVSDISTEGIDDILATAEATTTVVEGPTVTTDVLKKAAEEKKAPEVKKVIKKAPRVDLSQGLLDSIGFGTKQGVEELATRLSKEQLVEAISRPGLSNKHSILQKELDKRDEKKAPESKTPEFDKLPEKSETPTMTYAGIGARYKNKALKTSLDKEVTDAMTEIALLLNIKGYTLRSGAAEGADSAFEKGASNAKEIFRPKDATDLTRKIAKEIHPAPERLTPIALDFMARNTNQVFGKNLDTPVDFVLAWTPGGKEVGGTAQAIKMAKLKGIPVINLYDKNWRKKLDKIIGKEVPAVEEKAIVNEIKEKDLLKGITNLFKKGTTKEQLQQAFTKNKYLQEKIGEMFWWIDEVAIQSPEISHEIIPFLELVNPEIAKHWKIAIGWDLVGEGNKAQNKAQDESQDIINAFKKTPKDSEIEVKDHRFVNIPDWVRSPEALGNEYTKEYTDEQLGLIEDIGVLIEMAKSQGLIGPKLTDFVMKESKDTKLTKKDIEEEVKRLEALDYKYIEEKTEPYEPTLQTGEVVVYNGTQYIVRQVNASDKVQLINREEGKKFPGTPNASTVKAGFAIEQLQVVNYNGVPYIIDTEGFDNIIYSIKGNIITDPRMEEEIYALTLSGELKPKPVDVKIDLADGDLEMRKGVIESSFDAVNKEVKFDKSFGDKWKTTYYGPGTTYGYGGDTFVGKKWTKELEKIKKQVEELTGYTFNSAVINLYESGRNTISGHTDIEQELTLGVEYPVIASVSLGATRNFELIRLTDKLGMNLDSRKYEKGFYDFDKSMGDAKIKLEDKDLLLIDGETQRHYAHQIRKEDTNKPRISITFRRTAVPIKTEIKVIPNKDARRKAEDKGEGVDVTRKGAVIEQYGNPFIVPELWDDYYKRNGYIKAESVKDAIERYDAWLREEETGDMVKGLQRRWMLKQIDKGALDNTKLLYWKSTDDSHAHRLLKFVKERREEPGVRLQQEERRIEEPIEDRQEVIEELFTPEELTQARKWEKVDKYQPLSKEHLEEIFKNRKDKFALSDEQKEALRIVFNKPIGEPVILGGFAGTGKTTMIENIIRTYSEPGVGKKVYVTAPTNKAVLNIFDKTPLDLQDIAEDSESNIQFDTIHKTLYRNPSEKTVAGKAELRFGEPNAYGEDSIIIVDEASMLEWKIYNDLLQSIKQKGGAKVIFLGDNFQLPPIGRTGWKNNQNGYYRQMPPEIDSKVKAKGKFGYFSVLEDIGKGPDIVMQQVFRQKLHSKLMQYVTALRAANLNGQIRTEVFLPPIGKSKDSKGDGYVDVQNSNEFIKNFHKDVRNKKVKTTLITHQNKDRENFNFAAREAKFDYKKDPILQELDAENRIIDAREDGFYPDYNPKKPALKGDQLISLSNSLSFVNAHTFELGEPKVKHKVLLKVFQKTDENRKAVFEYYPAYIIEDKLSSKNDIFLIPSIGAKPTWVSDKIRDIFPYSNDLIPDYKNSLFPEYKHDRFDGISDKYAITTYAYSITAHKAQGSEWDRVYVYPSYLTFHFKDAKWLYTAATRGKTQLIFSADNLSSLPTKSWDEINELATKSSQKKFMLERKKAVIQTAAKKTETKKHVKMLFDKFEGKIPYSFVDDVNLTNSSGRYVSAYYDVKEKKIVVNLAYATPVTAFHEYMHPFLIDMSEQNPLLYDKLIEDILSDEYGKELLLDVFEIYDRNNQESAEIDMEQMSIFIDVDALKNSNLDINEIEVKDLTKLLKKYDNYILKTTGEKNKLSDELLAIAVSEDAVGAIPKSKGKIKKLIERIFNWIRNKLFGPVWSSSVYARAMDMNTTISDIAKLLANSNRKFGLEVADRRLLKSQYDFDVNNRYKFLAFTEKEMELNDAADADRQWLNSFYTRIWSLAGEAGYPKKEDFAAIMIGSDGLLKESLYDSFSIWYRGKFRKSVVPDPNKEFIGADSIYDIAKIEIDDNKAMLDKMEHTVAKDQRDLYPSNLVTLPGFNIQLHSTQLNRLIRLAKKYEDDFDGWIKVIFSRGEVLQGKRADMVQWKRNELLQWFNSLNNTAKVNRGSDLQEITNYELSIQSLYNPDTKTTKYDFKLVPKGPEKRFRARKYNFEEDKPEFLEKSSNPGWQKKTLVDSNYFAETAGLFKWLSGTDIRRKKVYDPLVVGKHVEEYSNLYGFLSEDELLQLDEHLIKNNLTIAFSRGDSDKIAIVDITPEHKKHAATKQTLVSYLRKEIDDGYLTPDQGNLIFKDKNYGDAKKRAALIATHEAMKVVWPKYALDKGEGPNIYKRLKIPFTPITNNKQMRDVRIMKFDPKKVKFQYGYDEEGKAKTFSPMKIVPGKKKQYIGDGESITSRKLFKEFETYFGLKIGTDVAKTVQYFKQADDVYALKHLHVRARTNWKIIDSKGRNLFKITGNGNIYLGSAHPLYDDKDNDKNYVDQLDTRDEIKIGGETIEDDGFSGIFEKNNGELIIPGSAVGFIKFEEGHEKHAKAFQQWWNHLTDFSLVKHFEENYLPIAEKGVRDAIRVAIDTNKKTSAEKIAQLGSVLESKDNVGRIPTLLELLKLGAGKHHQTASLVDRLIQNKHVEPAMQLEKMNGSTYNVAMDVTNTIGEGEISISRQGAKEIIDRFKRAHKGLDTVEGISNEEIGTWLRENPVYAAVTRFPVPHESGTFMARVVALHGRQAVAEMNIIDVKHRIDGDNDGDHIIVEFLPTREMTEDFVKHMKTLELKPQSLQKFIDPKKSKDIFKFGNKHKLISRLTTGKMAIGEIANIQAAYGSIRHIFESLSHKESFAEIIPRAHDEMIDFKVFYNGKIGWRGTVSDYLRLLLQASVDNGKYGLLGEWNYNRNDIIRSLFKYKDGSAISDADFALAVSPLFGLHIKANQIRNGRTINDGIFSFRTTIEKSGQYKDYAIDRVGYLNALGVTAKIKNNALTPIEMLAITPARIMEEMTSNEKYNLFGYDISPYITEFIMQQNAHRETMLSMDISKEDFIQESSIQDNKEGDLDYILSEIEKGMDYADEMGTELDTLIEKFKELGPQSMDYNDRFVRYKEDYHVKFKNLSNVAKVAATYRWLEGYRNNRTLEEKNISGNILPPVSESPGQVTLLDAGIIKQYFSEFNKKIKDKQNIKISDKKWKYRALKRIAEDMCK